MVTQQDKKIAGSAYHALLCCHFNTLGNFPATCRDKESNLINDNFILGDGALHRRLCTLTEVLGKFVASAPRPLSLSQLSESTSLTEKELAKLCAGLVRAALLQFHAGLGPKAPGHWALTCSPDQVTLEDVFRCVMAEQATLEHQVDITVPSGRRRQCLPPDADLLVTQAALAINQSVVHHLRQFSLDRLNVSTRGRLRATSMSRYSSSRIPISV